MLLCEGDDKKYLSNFSIKSELKINAIKIEYPKIIFEKEMG